MRGVLKKCLRSDPGGPSLLIPAQSESLGVTDGESFTVLTAKRHRVVRHREVDAEAVGLNEHGSAVI